MGEVNKRKLIVNYLPQQLTDPEFEQLFAPIGSLKSSQIIRNHSTGYSYGFGFVEYDNEADAAGAIERLNGHRLMHKTIKVAYSRQGGNIKGAKLYVGNLPITVTEEQLMALFSSYGNIVQCNILVSQATGQSRGVGFVLFETKDQAEMALSKLNDFTPEGYHRPLRVHFAEENRGQSKDMASHTFAQVSGLMQSASNLGAARPTHPGMPSAQAPGSAVSAIAAVVAAASARARPGDLASSIYNSLTGALEMASNIGLLPAEWNSGAMSYPPPAYGHANVMRSGPSHLPLRRYNPLLREGNMIPAPGPAFAVKPGGHVLFVYNIGPATTEPQLRALFEPYGTVAKVDVIWDFAKNACKGYGFVTMLDYEAAAFAIRRLNGYSLDGKLLQVSFKK